MGACEPSARRPSCCCPSASAGAAPTTTATAAATRPSTLTVYAAASLTKTFEQIGEEFEADHDGRGGRVQLRRLLRPGRADPGGRAGRRLRVRGPRQHGEADRRGARGPGARRASRPTRSRSRSRPTTRWGSPSLADVTGKDVNLVICAPEVPCGAAAQKAAEAAGIELTPVSEEQSVTDVLAKVTSGEADAGPGLRHRRDRGGRRGARRRLPRGLGGGEHLPDHHGRRQRRRRPGGRTSSSWC